MNVTPRVKGCCWLVLGGVLLVLVGGTVGRPTPAEGLQPASRSQPSEPAYVIDDCEDITPWQASGEVSVSQVSGRPGAGSALELTFTTEVKKAPAFAYRGLQIAELWDLPEGGLSFWTKGDGSDGFFEVELVDTSFKLRYAALVGLSEAEWHKVSIPWREFGPELYHAQFQPWPVMRPEGGIKPHVFWHLFLGRWFYFLNYFGPYQVTIDDIAVEADVPFDETDYTPAEAGIPRTRAKLRARQPVTVVCMGDSITFGVGAGGPAQAYPGKLEARLRERFGYDDVHVVNSGVGGLQVLQGSVLIPRDVVPHQPDLVTVLYGYNDLSGGVAKKDQFKTAVSVFVDRVRRHTKGKAEVVLVASLPGTSPEAWERLEAGAEAMRELAREKRCGLCDASAAFRAVGREALITQYFRANDPAHPNATGQDLLAKLLLEAIAGE